jgi:Rrf2 family protein
MKFTAQEEYGLRCLLQIARAQNGEHGLTIPELSKAEGISTPYVAKIMRVLRQGGYVRSARGKVGGYTLARPPEQIPVGDILELLGGRLFESEFCDRYAGDLKVCKNTSDCSIRSLWRVLQFALDRVLRQTTLRDLLRSEGTMNSWSTKLITLGNEPADALH